MDRPEPTQDEEAVLASAGQDWREDALAEASKRACEAPTFADFSQAFPAEVPEEYRQGMYEQYSKMMASMLTHCLSASRVALQQTEAFSLQLHRQSQKQASTKGMNENSLRSEVDKGNKRAQDIDAQRKVVQEHLEQMRSKNALLRTTMRQRSTNVDLLTKLDDIVDTFHARDL